MKYQRMISFLERLLDPEDLGHAVSQEVRENARQILRTDSVKFGNWVWLTEEEHDQIAAKYCLRAPVQYMLELEDQVRRKNS